MSDPLAYFLTWTTYGTWLPGDQRGWVKRNAPGVQAPDEKRRRVARSTMTHTPVVLSQKERELIDDVIRAHAEFKGWKILALNVRTNHVHLVIEADVPPREVMRQMKMWATRKLNEATNRDRLWTKKGTAGSCSWMTQSRPQFLIRWKDNEIHVLAHEAQWRGVFESQMAPRFWRIMTNRPDSDHSHRFKTFKLALLDCLHSNKVIVTSPIQDPAIVLTFDFLKP
jgi:hypothetical protein